MGNHRFRLPSAMRSRYSTTSLLALTLMALLAACGTANAPSLPPVPTATNSPTATPTPVDPYAGWLTYCSTSGGICFKYPSDWTLAKSTDPTSGTDRATVTNRAHDVVVVYTAYIYGIGGVCPPNTCFFTTDALTSLSSGFKLVKGVFTNGGPFLPMYFVASADTVQQYKLQVNQNVDVGFFAGLFDSPLNRSKQEELRVAPNPDNGFASRAEAEAWLAKPDVVAAGKILGSVYLNT
jgi:hypothetical protein